MKRAKKITSLFLVIVILSAVLFGCSKQTIAQKDTTKGTVFFDASKQTVAQEETYNGRVFYEIFVRAFNDSNNDGIGDLKGVTEKLDYLKDLGVKGIWLMPINASPSYHGYDISDYYKINPDYGTMDDYKELIKEAHKRDIKVEMDMVINHTSTENAWFKAASTDKNSKYKNYYLWTSDKNVAAEGSPVSAQPWTPLGNEFYYSLFWSGMPDLNYDNKAVRAEIKNISKYYLDMGVDGFRLDAAMWIYNDEAKNLAWWQEYKDYVKSINKDAVIVGEVWQNDSKLIAPYYKSLDSSFNFPVADAIVKNMRGGTIGSIINSINNAYESYKAVNKDFIDSPFISNHDMNRSMDTFQNLETAKQAAAILLTLPGTPYVYYGEETGMTGSKPDEQIRQPFIWDNKDASKNTKWEVSSNNLNKVAVNVQENDKNSLLNFYKAFINLRNASNALRLGDFEDLVSKNNRVAAYKRVYKDEAVYVYINTSKIKVEENIDLKKANVIYSNKKSDRNLTFNGKVSLEGSEILLLEK